jgi:hypothetical protein
VNAISVDTSSANITSDRVSTTSGPPLMCDGAYQGGHTTEDFGFQAFAVESAATGDNWTLRVSIICANVTP